MQPGNSNSKYTLNIPIRIWKKGDMTRISYYRARYDDDSYA